jgi:hypothetical protein
MNYSPANDINVPEMDASLVLHEGFYLRRNNRGPVLEKKAFDKGTA